MKIRNEQPQELWRYFEDLNAVPRASKKEEEVIDFMLDFGRKLNLYVIKDSIGNVIIKKPATDGMGDRQTVILQSHLDMVHQKNADVNFDFETEGIKMYIKDGFLQAKGTTLGADNGIGVAAIMALLASKEIAHPPLEALFTIDEETGMTGAKNLEGEYLSGRILLNLDTEEDDEIDIGCAGGVDTIVEGKYSKVPAMNEGLFYELSITGLKGGHSGMDIIKELANANKIMNRVLLLGNDLECLQVVEINGGSLRNAIPRESFAKLIISKEKDAEFKEVLESLTAEIKSEFSENDPNIDIKLTISEEIFSAVMDSPAQTIVLNAIQGCFNGVFAMSKVMDGLVETSSNLARVLIQDGTIHIGTLQRSSVESRKWDVAKTVAAPFVLSGYNVEHKGSYPGWDPDVHSEILKTAKASYERLFKEEPRVVACHAGLECGILKEHLPNTEMISFGPNIFGAHSPDERVEIKSVQKFWIYLQDILLNMPKI